MSGKKQAMTCCPKCGHQQEGREECAVCGLLFHRFEQVRDRRQEQSRQEDTRPAPGGRGYGSLVVAALVLVVLTASLTAYFLAGRHQGPAPVPPQSPPDQAAVSAVSPPPASVRPAPLPSAPVVVKASPIEQAKNATVAIETPWGKGSGFFISETTIVTNKHVVAPDRSHLDKERQKLATSRKLISLEQEKITDLRRRLQQMADGPSRRQLIIIIQESEKELARVLPLQAEGEARLKAMERPLATADIKIFLADGSEHTAQSSRVSPERDLALLSLYSVQPAILQPAPQGRVLNQGDKVYTVGNPVGLRNTVTAGVFSGYRQHQESKEVLLQTDAPINPGNSGGPLIDEHGLVHGVNTMIWRNTQGIGFAIPIRTVLEEFDLTPTP